VSRPAKPGLLKNTTSGNWRVGFALALTTALFWGLLPIALKLLLVGMDPVTITWYRFAVASMALGLFLKLRRRLPIPLTLDRSAWVSLGICVLGLTGNFVLYILGLSRASPTVTQVVIQLSPLLLLLGGLVVFRERFTPLQWSGFVVLVAGMLLFFNRRLPELAHVSSGVGLGVLLLVIAALLWAAYALAQKHLLRSLASEQILFLLYSAAVVLLFPPVKFSAILDLTRPQFGLLAFCCANTLIAYGAFVEALGHWEVSRVSAVISTAPLFTLLGMRLLELLSPGLMIPEELNGFSVLGALGVVVGSSLCALGSRAAEPGA
jgi:drug/metabolite transporter (DMT)-like permease